MKSKKTLNQIFALSLITFLMGCGGGSSSSDTDNEGNKAPEVNAGADTTAILNQPITIIGTATDEDGTISNYEWKKGSDTLGTEASLTYTPTKVGTDSLTFVAIDDDGESASDEVKITVQEENALPSVDLPTASKKMTSVFMQKSDGEIIKDSVSTLSFGYYRDEDRQQWYISHIDLSNKVNVYSLTPFRGGKNGWGTVGENVAKFNSNAESIKIGNIADNNEYRYYDKGWKVWNTDPMIQDHISWIRNDNVNIEWWFFKASNGAWYIVNKAGLVRKFASANNDYDWQEIDMGGAKPTFSMDNGVKKMSYKAIDNNPTLTAYPSPELSSKYYKSENAFYMSNHNLKGECTWYSYGRVVELYNKGVISKKAYNLVHKLWGKSGRHAKNWSSKIGISGQGFSTDDDVLPVEKRKRGLLAIWECGDFGHVGFVEEIGGANKEWYRLSDSNRGGHHKYKTAKYSFDSYNVVSGTSDDKLRVYGGVSCYPTFYDLEK